MNVTVQQLEDGAMYGRRLAGAGRMRASSGRVSGKYWVMVVLGRSRMHVSDDRR